MITRDLAELSDFGAFVHSHAIVAHAVLRGEGAFKGGSPEEADRLSHVCHQLDIHLLGCSLPGIRDFLT